MNEFWYPKRVVEGQIQSENERCLAHQPTLTMIFPFALLVANFSYACNVSSVE